MRIMALLFFPGLAAACGGAGATHLALGGAV
jgi:hypothetical protein